MDDEISLVDLLAQRTAVVRGRATPETIPDFLGSAFEAVARIAPTQGLQLIGPPFARYGSMDETGWDLEAGFPVDGDLTPVDGVEGSSLPAGRAARLVHTGPYDTIGTAWRAVSDWIVDNGYAATDTPWECYLDEPGVEPPRTLILMPCGEPVRR